MSKLIKMSVYASLIFNRSIIAAARGGPSSLVEVEMDMSTC